MNKQHLKTLLIVAAVVIFYVVITVIGYLYFYKKNNNQESQPNIIEQLMHDDWKKDGCEGDRQCKACKRKIKCLDCTHECYNRYGIFTQKDNPFIQKAILCNKTCWDKSFPESPDIDFDIPPIRPKK